MQLRSAAGVFEQAVAGADAFFSQELHRPVVYPLPAKGILVAMTVRNWTLASSGRPAM
jgi:hypothetical protein